METEEKLFTLVVRNINQDLYYYYNIIRLFALDFYV